MRPRLEPNHRHSSEQLRDTLRPWRRPRHPDICTFEIVSAKFEMSRSKTGASNEQCRIAKESTRGVRGNTTVWLSASFTSFFCTKHNAHHLKDEQITCLRFLWVLISDLSRLHPDINTISWNLCALFALSCDMCAPKCCQGIKLYDRENCSVNRAVQKLWDFWSCVVWVWALTDDRTVLLLSVWNENKHISD